MHKLTTAAIAAFFIAGCSEQTPNSKKAEAEFRSQYLSTRLYETSLKLQGGRTVTCIIYSEHRNGSSGLSCDWAHANK